MALSGLSSLLEIPISAIVGLRVPLENKRLFIFCVGARVWEIRWGVVFAEVRHNALLLRVVLVVCAEFRCPLFHDWFHVLKRQVLLPQGLYIHLALFSEYFPVNTDT